MVETTIIMGVYNGAKNLNRSIPSILEQSYRDYEFIICDDGSSDNSLDLIKKYAESDSRIIVLSNKVNLGLAPTLNKCLSIANGIYIARMDDDDISLPFRLETQIEFLKRNPQYSIVGTSRYLYGKKGIWGKDIIFGERSTLDIYKGSSFVHPSAIIIKDAIQNAGNYTCGKKIGRTEDYDLWCKMYKKGYKGYNLPDILLSYYEDLESFSKRKYKYRISEFFLKLYWRKELGVKFRFIIYAFKPLIVGLFPPKILTENHFQRFKINKEEVI